MKPSPKEGPQRSKTGLTSSSKPPSNLLNASAVNEATNNMALGFPILIAFFIAGFVIYMTIDYAANDQAIRPTLVNRIRASKEYVR